MRTSFAKFDKASASEKLTLYTKLLTDKRNHLDAIMKLVRLMANLFTLDRIGIDFVIKYAKEYNFLLRHVCAKIKDKDVEANTVKKVLKIK